MSEIKECPNPGYEIKDGTMCWIGLGERWLDIVVFNETNDGIVARFGHYHLTASAFRDLGYAISPIPYPVYLPKEIKRREKEWAKIEEPKQ